MDFVKFLPAELCESIFQYLESEELLDPTVCKGWYSFIGSSSVLMKDIKLFLCRINERNPIQDEDKKALTDSTRAYQHLEIKVVRKKLIGDICNIFKSKVHNVKTLKLKNVEFETTRDIANFIGFFEPTLEQLTLESIHVTTYKKCDKLNFKKLKSLQIESFDRVGFTDIFVHCKELVDLLVCSSVSYDSVKPLLKVLNQSEKLEKLNISLQFFSTVLNTGNALPNFPFKLKSLELDTNHEEWTATGFKEIFSSQFNSLRKFHMTSTSSADILQLCYTMPNLIDLNLGVVKGKFDLGKHPLKINAKLQKLKFHDSTNNFISLKPLVKASPNVKELLMYTLSQEALKIISDGMLQLEKLRLRTIDADDLSDKSLFPKLTLCAVEVINCDLDDHMEEILVENRNSLVRLVLGSNYVILH